MGMTIDMSDFEKGFKELINKSTPEALAKGMYQAGNALIKDAINEEPYVPFDEGGLRRSGTVNEAKVSDGAIETEVGFNIGYAARWHELTPAEDKRINWTLPGSGRKYLESKMARNAFRYLAIAGEHLKKALRG